MATLAELFALHQTAELRHKVAAAAMIKAHAILAEATPSATRKQWAEDALLDPESVAPLLLRFVLAANAAATSTAIQGATDTAIQANVNAAVDELRP